MEDTLKRLLAAETRANEITDAARLAADRLVQDALRESRAMEERFQSRLPALRAGYLDKAEKRAAQSIQELQRRYDEILNRLRDDAERQEGEALEAAFAYLLYRRNGGEP
ncbi:MAG: ATPase [Gammaproteobacteria bacterium]|nr:ATPase [Gammaproteobacteria bacterium]MBU1655243.1 ATPase [Gammaproteobacteria bacterium]MBU1961328.1 ATPase [Gammaproteobacteria bacterium]